MSLTVVVDDHAPALINGSYLSNTSSLGRPITHRPNVFSTSVPAQIFRYTFNGSAIMVFVPRSQLYSVDQSQTLCLVDSKSVGITNNTSIGAEEFVDGTINVKICSASALNTAEMHKLEVILSPNTTLEKLLAVNNTTTTKLSNTSMTSTSLPNTSAISKNIPTTIMTTTISPSPPATTSVSASATSHLAHVRLIIAVVVPVGIFLVLGFIIYLAVSRRKRRKLKMLPLVRPFDADALCLLQGIVSYPGTSAFDIKGWGRRTLPPLSIPTSMLSLPKIRTNDAATVPPTSGVTATTGTNTPTAVETREIQQIINVSPRQEEDSGIRLVEEERGSIATELSVTVPPPYTVS